MEKLQTEIPQYAAKGLSVLEQSGEEAWLVGGCVRDVLRGEIPHDWDICTSASPEKTLKAFSAFHTIPTGIKHGTVTVIIDGNQVEVTTYRTDGEYTDHRRPDSVSFVSDIKSDLMRRDFTMNAICMNKNGEIYDPFGGREDIKNGIIRCVGDPEKRFDEDALRILRAIRFAAKTGFEIESETERAAFEMCGLLDNVSAERIYSELKSMLIQPHITDILLKYREIIGQFIPELKPCFDFPQNTPHHCYDVWKHIAVSVGNIRADETLRTVMLFHDIGKPDMFYADSSGVAHFKKHPRRSAEYADKILRRLKSDTVSRKLICGIISEHDNRISPDRKTVRRFISQYGYDFFYEWLEVRRADTLAQSEYLREEKLHEQDVIREIGDELRRQESCVSIGQLAIDGNDLVRLGFGGREIGQTLGRLLDGVIDERIPNEREKLLAAAVDNTADEDDKEKNLNGGQSGNA